MRYPEISHRTKLLSLPSISSSVNHRSFIAQQPHGINALVRSWQLSFIKRRLNYSFISKPGLAVMISV
jgi:hypothetical protein